MLLSLARCPREEAVRVLRQCGCDVQRAADLLFHRVEAGALPAGAAACTNSSHQRTALSGSSSVAPELSASQARVQAGQASQVDSAGAGCACASDALACSRPGTGTITSFFAPRGQAHTSASKTARCPPEEAASSGHDRAAAGGASQADLDMQDKIAKIVEIGIANRDQAAAALSASASPAAARRTPRGGPSTSLRGPCGSRKGRPATSRGSRLQAGRPGRLMGCQTPPPSRSPRPQWR